MDDLISRQAAIDAVRKLYIKDPKINNDYAYDMALDKVDDAMRNLPSVQPEIVRCKDCKYYHDSDGCFFSTAETGDDGFCHWAERKTDE